MENPAFTYDELIKIKERVNNKTATELDYQNLDTFLNSIGLGGYILRKIKERGYLNYQNYIQNVNSDSVKKDRFSESFIHGAVMETIALLIKFISVTPNHN